MECTYKNFTARILTRQVPFFGLQLLEVCLFGQIEVQRGDRDVPRLQFFDVRSVIEQMTANGIQAAPVVSPASRVDALLDLFRDASDTH